MSRIVIIVHEGMASYVNDQDTQVLLIDADDLSAGAELSRTHIAGFEDLVPEWIKSNYVVDSDEFYWEHPESIPDGF